MTTAPHRFPRASSCKPLRWLFLALILPVCLLFIGCERRPDHGRGTVGVPLPTSATDLHSS